MAGPFFGSNAPYKIGSKNNVASVAVTNPPMITTAKGRAVSAPTPVESAAGNSPKAAISDGTSQFTEAAAGDNAKVDAIAGPRLGFRCFRGK